jgi:hypothetical protein
MKKNTFLTEASFKQGIKKKEVNVFKILDLKRKHPRVVYSR